MTQWRKADLLVEKVGAVAPKVAAAVVVAVEREQEAGQAQQASLRAAGATTPTPKANE
jgi:hypothetical protein